MKNSHIQNLKVKGGEVEVIVNKDGLTSQGPSVIIAGNLGTMRMSAKRSRPNQARTEQISSKKVTLKHYSFHIKLLKKVRVYICG